MEAVKTKNHVIALTEVAWKGVRVDIMVNEEINVHVLVFDIIIQFNTIQYNVILCDIILIVYHAVYTTESKNIRI